MACSEVGSCREILFLGSAIARLAVDRSAPGDLDEAGPDFRPGPLPISPARSLIGREHALTQALSSCLSRPCPSECGHSAPALRASNDGMVSSKRDVLVSKMEVFIFTLLPHFDFSQLIPFTNVLPQIILDPFPFRFRLWGRLSGQKPEHRHVS